MKGHQMLSKLRKDQENEEGFTLIELLVVVIIIGILAAIAIPAFLNQRERAWQSELTSAVRNSALEVESEATKLGGKYPADAAGKTLVDAFITANVNDTTGDPIRTVVYKQDDAGAGFTLCMESSKFGTKANSQRYLGGTTGNGLQDFAETNCTTTGS